MTTPLSNIAIKRICSDMKDLNRHPLEDEGIFHSYDESNMQNCRIMMIGPEDTPYEGGFYLFHFTFPSNYPFEPPKVKYCTQGNNIRFNPNLYTCGKVCLSLINTWEGPKWTSCQTIRSVLISLRGLVLGVKYPLQNEPGYESSTDVRATGFNDVVLHENYRTAVVGMMNNPPPGFEVFIPKMVEYVGKNFSTYEKKLKELSQFDNTDAVSPVYNMRVKRNFTQQLSAIKKILENHGVVMDIPKKTKNILLSEADYSDDEDTSNKKKIQAMQKKAEEDALLKKKAEDEKAAKKLAEQAAKNLAKEDKVAKKVADQAAKQHADEEKAAKKGADLAAMADKIVEIVFSTDTLKKKPAERKAPKEPAKNYEVGQTMNGLDGKTYIVKSIGTGDTKYNRWFLTNEAVDTNQSAKTVDTNQSETIVVVKSGDDFTDVIVKSEEVKEVETVEQNEEVKDEKKKPVRRAPKEHAKNHPEGFELIGEDQKLYVVKTIGAGEEKSFKRWVLKK